LYKPFILKKQKGGLIKTLVFYFIIFSATFAQIDTTNWYPLAIGNKWQYCYGIATVDCYTTEVIGDTLMPNSKTYAILAYGEDKNFLRNHENQYVFVYNHIDSTEYLLYDFISEDGTIWEFPHGDNLWGILGTGDSYDYYNWVNTKLAYKLFDNVFIDSSTTPPDTTWGMLDVFSTQIIQGIGFTPHFHIGYLNGAIINGVKYGTITSVDDKTNYPNVYKLKQNYPNPFNPNTTISYSIPQNAFVNLTVYNSLGEIISILVSKYQPNGNYSINFNSENLSSGIYFYRIQVNDFMQTKKMVLLR